MEQSFKGEWGSIADTASVSSWESDESLFSPSVSPWVLNGPWVVTDSNESDSVVEGSLTVIENSWRVFWPVGGINSNWNGSAGNSESQVVAASDISESADLESSWANLAGSLSSSVWVFFLGDNSVVLNEFKGVVHETSIASVVSIRGRAVNELLFGEALEFSISKLG